MTILEKFHVIEKHTVIYNIHYCRAGIGFIFYSPPKELPVNTTTQWGYPENWRHYLRAGGYYPTFEEMVEAEYKQLGLAD